MVLTRRSRKKTPKPRRILVRKSFKDKKNKLIKQTLKKVNTKLINNPDEQLKRQILKNIERVIDGENDESDSNSDPRKSQNSKNSPKRVRHIISDSSDNENDENSANIYKEIYNLKDFQVKVKKLTHQEIAKLSGNDRLEQIEELPQSNLNIDENSSSDDVLIQEADNAKEPQTESRSEVIELDDDDDDCDLTEINAQVSDLIKDLTLELPQNSAPIVPQRKRIDPNEVIVIDDDDDDDIEQNHQKQTNTTSNQKPSRILVINGEKLKELLESGDDIQTICSKLGLSSNKQQQPEHPSVVNEKPTELSSKISETETLQQPEPETVNVPECLPSNAENTVPENVTSDINDNNINEKSAKTKKSKRQKIVLKFSHKGKHSKTIGKKATKNHIHEEVTQESSLTAADNTNVGSIQVDSDSNSSSPVETEATSNIVPSESKKETPNKKKLVFKIMKSGSPSNKSYIMKPSDGKSQLTSQKESASPAAKSILKVNQKTNPTQEARIEDLTNVPKPVEEVCTSKTISAPSTSNNMNQVPSTAVNLETEASSANPIIGGSTHSQRIKPIRRESLLRVKSFANESLMAHFKSNVSSTIKSSANNPDRRKSTPAVNMNSRSNTNPGSLIVNEVLKQRAGNSNQKLQVAMQSRSKLRPWIKDAKPEPYYKIKLELLSCPSLHADYKCMNLKCAFFTSSAELFSKHLQQHLLSDPANTILACPYCTFQTSNVDGLIQHITVYHEYDRYMCEYCFYRALDLSNVMWHMKQFHPTSHKSVFELYSKKLFLKVNPNIIYELMRRNVPPLNCLFCERKFMTFEMYMNHLQNHIGTSDFALTCSICNGHVNKQSLIQHFNACYGFGVYQCINCKYGTDDISCMREHLANEHPSKLIIMAQRKYKNSAITDYSDPTFLTIAKAPTKVDPSCTRIFNYKKEMLLNENNVLRIDYADVKSHNNSFNSRNVVQARRTTINFDQSIPCSIIERPNANSTVTSNIAPTVYQAVETNPPVEGINGNALSIRQPQPNIRTSLPMVFIPFIPTSLSQNYVYTNQQQFSQTRVDPNATSINHDTGSEQIVVPRINGVYSFHNVH